MYLMKTFYAVHQLYQQLQYIKIPQIQLFYALHHEKEIRYKKHQVNL